MNENQQVLKAKKINENSDYSTYMYTLNDRHMFDVKVYQDFSNYELITCNLALKRLLENHDLNNLMEFNSMFVDFLSIIHGTDISIEFSM